MDPERLLYRFLELADGSAEYFVSGSFSFLPRLPGYREPDHDLDVAVERRLFHRMCARLRPEETVHPLSLPQVALADESLIARLVPLRTSFVHLRTAVGLLDCAVYAVTRSALSFGLGPGLRLDLPRSVLDRVRQLMWRGHAYRAGPLELAFVPKAVAYRRQPAALPPRHLEDLRRLAPLVDPDFLGELASAGGVRVFGRKLPRRLDPFAGLEECCAAR